MGRWASQVNGPSSSINETKDVRHNIEAAAHLGQLEGLTEALWIHLVVNLDHGYIIIIIM